MIPPPPKTKKSKKSKKLHKNTDLGYFAAMFVASDYSPDDAIIIAKELIKKLDLDEN